MMSDANHRMAPSNAERKNGTSYSEVENVISYEWEPANHLTECLSTCPVMGVRHVDRRNGRMRCHMSTRTRSLCDFIEHTTSPTHLSEINTLASHVVDRIINIYQVLSEMGVCWSVTRLSFVQDMPMDATLKMQWSEEILYACDEDERPPYEMLNVPWTHAYITTVPTPKFPHVLWHTFLSDLFICESGICIKTGKGIIVYGEMDPVLFFTSICRQLQLTRLSKVLPFTSNHVTTAETTLSFVSILIRSLGEELSRRLSEPERGALCTEVRMVDFLTQTDYMTACVICTFVTTLVCDGAKRTMATCWCGWITDRAHEAILNSGLADYVHTVSQTICQWYTAKCGYNIQNINDIHRDRVHDLLGQSHRDRLVSDESFPGQLLILDVYIQRLVTIDMGTVCRARDIDYDACVYWCKSTMIFIHTENVTRDTSHEQDNDIDFESTFEQYEYF
jgi:hypothetical protein